MEKSTLLIWGGVVLAVMIGIGQTSEQAWKLRPTGDPDSLQLTIHRYKPGNNFTWVSDVPISRFRNLSRETIGHGGATQFDYVTDAGKLVCKGRFSWNSGAGTYAFVPNPDFATELSKLDYTTPDSNQLFDMLISDVSLEFARAVHDAGLHATSAQLLELRHHGVDRNFMRDVKELGYHFSAADVIDLRNHGVDGDFLRDLEHASYEIPAREIVELRNHGVDGDFLREMKQQGLHPRSGELVEMRNHGVGADYLHDLKSAGYDTLTIEQAIELHNHGVPADFARDALQLGYRFTPQELIGLHNHGVSGDYLRTLKESGIRDLNAAQIERLRQNGVE